MINCPKCSSSEIIKTANAQKIAQGKTAFCLECSHTFKPKVKNND